jgi:DNA-binding transcriptional LysR family regulator
VCQGNEPRRPGAPNRMRYTLRQLEYFIATCDAGSVTEAAQNIPVSQSSVSAAIAQLEAALGVQLFIRHHAQGVSPTPVGRQFLVRARALLREAGELERFASELTDELGGVLELGCLVTLAPIVSPRLCQSFRESHPAVTIELVEAGQDELLARLRDGTLALALTYDLELAEDIDFAPLAALPPHAVFAADHPLAARASVAIGELSGEPLVLLDLPHSREYFRSLFMAESVTPTIAHRSKQPEAIRTLVANGYGYTIVNARPLLDRALDGRPLKTVPLAGSPRPMRLGVARLAESRPTRIVSGFLDHCRATVADSGLPGLHTDA